MTSAVSAAASELTGPALLYDLGLIGARMVSARRAARAEGVRLAFAVKSLPIAAVVERAAGVLDGVDVAGPEEQRAALALAPTAVSVTYPGGIDGAAVAALAARHRVTVTCETADQVAAACDLPDVRVAIRVSASALTGEDAAGGIRTDDGAMASRFGAAPTDLAELVVAGRGRVRGLLVHGGPLATAPSTLARRARAALAAAADAELPLEFLDLGGSLHGFAIDAAASGVSTLAAAFAAARAEVPASVELWFEPGRLFSEGAGFAAGRVVAARELAGGPARVLDLSRLCHLRWSTPRLSSPPPRPGDSTVVRLLGATCCEDDVIGDARVRPEHLPALGDQVILGGISGYAAGWNRGFAGVPAARVVLVGGER